MGVLCGIEKLMDFVPRLSLTQDEKIPFISDKKLGTRLYIVQCVSEVVRAN